MSNIGPAFEGGIDAEAQDKDGDWLIENPQIVTQEIGGTTCDLDKEEFAKISGENVNIEFSDGRININASYVKDLKLKLNPQISTYLNGKEIVLRNSGGYLIYD